MLCQGPTGRVQDTAAGPPTARDRHLGGRPVSDRVDDRRDAAAVQHGRTLPLYRGGGRGETAGRGKPGPPPLRDHAPTPHTPGLAPGLNTPYGMSALPGPA